MKTPPGKVPCGSCKACCRREMIVIHPEHGDNPLAYAPHVDETVNPLNGKRVLVLKRKANGECIFLRAGGCSIHDRAPAMCREFDCRVAVLMAAKAGSLMRAAITPEVRRAGTKRLDTLQTGTDKNDG